MSRKKREVKHSILIVCEGSQSEPNYFGALLKSVEAQYPDGLAFEIQPKGNYDEGIQNPPNPHKSARKKRTLLNHERPLEDEVESEFRSMPTRMVRAAQLGLQQSAYDQAFAIFDKDGHPNPKAAFDLAEQGIHGKKVEIGFTSIAFEHWVLLHFEYSDNAFEKSECKVKKKPISCGTNTNKIDCNGTKCVAGYLRTHGLLDYSKVCNDLWSILEPNLKIAYRNAAWLRHCQNQTPQNSLYFELNPISTLDLVIQKIRRENEAILCITPSETVSIQAIDIKIIDNSRSKIIFEIKNKGQIGFIFKPSLFLIHDSLGQTLLPKTKKQTIEKDGGIFIQFEIHSNFSFSSPYLVFQSPNSQLLFPTPQE